MARLPRTVRANPIPVVLSAGAVLVGLATVGLAATGAGTRLLIRLAALTVVLTLFAGWFWLHVLGERMG